MILLVPLLVHNFHVALLDIFYTEFGGIWSAIFLLIQISNPFNFFLKFVYLWIILCNLQNHILFKLLVWLTLQNVFIFVAKNSFEFSFKLCLITFWFDLCDFVIDFRSFLLSFICLQNLISLYVKNFSEGQNIVMAHFLDRLNVLLLPRFSISCLLMRRRGNRLLKHEA